MRQPYQRAVTKAQCEGPSINWSASALPLCNLKKGRSQSGPLARLSHTPGIECIRTYVRTYVRTYTHYICVCTHACMHVWPIHAKMCKTRPLPPLIALQVPELNPNPHSICPDLSPLHGPSWLQNGWRKIAAALRMSLGIMVKG